MCKISLSISLQKLLENYHCPSKELFMFNLTFQKIKGSNYSPNCISQTISPHKYIFS